MKTIQFKINGEPFGWQRIGADTRGNRPRFFTKEDSKFYANMVANAAFAAHKEKPHAGPVAVWVTAIHSRPKSNKDWAPWNRKPDGDNIAKIILDAMNKIVYNDDRQVIDLRVEKKFVSAAVPRPCTHICVKLMGKTQ